MAVHAKQIIWGFLVYKNGHPGQDDLKVGWNTLYVYKNISIRQIIYIYFFTLASSISSFGF